MSKYKSWSEIPDDVKYYMSCGFFNIYYYNKIIIKYSLLREENIYLPIFIPAVNKGKLITIQ